MLVAVGVVLLLLDLDGDGSPEAPRAGDTPAPTVRDEPIGDEQRREQSLTPTPSGSPAVARGPEAFVERYFTTLPEDTKSGWSMLGPAMRSDGRAAYEGWWSSLEDVTARDIVPAPSGDSVETTLTYRMKNGRVETERHRLELLRVPDGWLINGDESV